MLSRDDIVENMCRLQTSKLLEWDADGNVPHVRRLLRFQYPCDDDIRRHARKFGVMTDQTSRQFFCARQPASSVNFRFGHSITKSHWLQFTLYTTADEGRSFSSYCRFCRGKRLVFCGLSGNRVAKWSLVAAFHYLPLPSCTLIKCLPPY